MAKDTKYLILLSLLYFAVSFVGILHHELWLDEAQHWLLARDSNSVSQLIQNTRLEGHPLLWNLMLYGVTRFTYDPFWMQFLHILISSTAIVVFLRKAPFDWLFKALFIFGYFMVFEYNLISRNYSLGILFLFLACSLFEKREQRFSLFCLFLALAANTHLLFSVPAFALFLTLIVEQIQNKNFFQTKFFVGYSVFALGLILIYFQIHSTHSDWLLEPISRLSFPEKAIAGFISFFKGVVVIPNFRTLHFWNLNLIVDSYKPIAAILGLLMYALPLVLFFKNRKTLFFVYTALIGAQIFFFITQRTSTRFQGMTFLLIIIGLWIEHYYNPEDSKLKKILSSFRLASLQKPIVYSILLLHFGVGIYAYSMDFNYPFASAKETVDYLKSNKLDSRQIVSVSCEGTPISAYLQKKVYFLCTDSYQSFCRWDSVCGQIDDKEVIAMLDGHLLKEKHFVFVSYYGLTNKLVNDWVNISAKTKVRYLDRFDVSIGGTLNYYVFEVSKREE
ncbi:hypothetical protein [Flavobacterium wongokense]|uniref:hypothetical protein n=1 Tax=Flavobacterium wongokense TaxID=2910674 RepID=UPI001F48282F|nr:hypothetical protein [Flavobacterium sp. WG47]MCF6131627.1 hypothetical protein [Flavobacterium sp. WG47]